MGIGLALVAGIGLAAGPAFPASAAQEAIKIGQSSVYSGPASAFSTIPRLQAAYVRMLNQQGGIGGKAIEFISLDDAFTPAKAVENTRKLVEGDGVLFMFSYFGSSQGLATRKYLNSKGIPQLFVSSGAAAFGDYKEFPWTIGWPPTIVSEGRAVGTYIAENLKGQKIGILSENAEYGRDYIRGLKQSLGPAAADIVREMTYEVGDPTIDSQIISLKAADVSVLVDISTPKYAAQAIRKLDSLGWKPAHFIYSASASIGATITPVGADKAVGVMSATFFKDPNDPQWAGDPALKAWTHFMETYFPEGDRREIYNVISYLQGETLKKVLEQCDGDFSRANIMKQATNLDFQPGMLLPGIRIKTAPDDYYPIEQLQMTRFDGTRFVPFGGLISGK
ncbi:ABC transporter substrate-binding protein [Chelatococcus reniformis]|uniref:Branched-chain amino acid ABC transporter substrate-binding protein n=1 Tax=Chelatococcus reniformis TaxID=1494448 RepID=A0A916X8V0_9HYPH|nr:ABC transporter substrate-binding protein [Chelatococcus reniformis]GGC55487.1 branched-chain amino acid ABC transporter substrate-binding protein [Chelatococcus reniformis]